MTQEAQSPRSAPPEPVFCGDPRCDCMAASSPPDSAPTMEQKFAAIEVVQEDATGRYAMTEGDDGAMFRRDVAADTASPTCHCYPATGYVCVPCELRGRGASADASIYTKETLPPLQMCYGDDRIAKLHATVEALLAERDALLKTAQENFHAAADKAARLTAALGETSEGEIVGALQTWFGVRGDFDLTDRLRMQRVLAAFLQKRREASAR